MSASRSRPLRPREEPQPTSSQIPAITFNNGVQMQVESAKTPETRQRRIGKSVEMLRQRQAR